SVRKGRRSTLQPGNGGRAQTAHGCPFRPAMTPPLAIDHTLRAFRIPRPLHLNLGSGVMDGTQVFGRQLHRNRSDVLLQPMPLRRSRYRDDPGLLRKYPRKRYLGRCRVFALGDAANKVYYRLVRLSILRCKTWDAATEVGSVEGRVLVYLAREKAFSQRAKG